MAERMHPAVRVAPISNRPHGNWPLALGSLIVLGVLFVAIAGPAIAPRDPLVASPIVQLASGKFLNPPFPPLTVPGFPFGTDNLGRDLLSRVLWAVRPTLTLVGMVAAIRLVVGVIVGLLSGWSSGRFGRALNAAISAALATPVLFVALAVITALGSRAGLWAFVLGLSLTGWADAARLLREQTRGVKGQPYVEAARALGLSSEQILANHVLPQIMPLVWTQMAFEVSSALLTTAGLGFLGYFINAVWIPLGDWTGLRAAGAPELGQMLAISAQAHGQPWGMAIAGAMVVVIVLGFNLLGEGLQPAVGPARKRDDPASRAMDRVSGWVDGVVFDPLSSWRRTAAFAAAVAGVVALIVGGSFTLLRSRVEPEPAANLPMPGNALWGDARHDPYGTLWSNVNGPTSTAVAWVYKDATGYIGGPVVAADGTVYMVSSDRKLHAISPTGGELWQAPITGKPIGAPAIGNQGNIYVADAKGNLTSFTSNGAMAWHVDSGGTVAAIAGPTVSPDGTVYVPVEGRILAVTGDGRVKWNARLSFYAYISPLVTIDPSGQYVFFNDVVLDAATGGVVVERSIDPYDAYFVGTDGRIYLAGPGTLLEWQPTATGYQLTERAKWDALGLALGFRTLAAAGVMPGRRAWLLFAGEYEFAKMVWIDWQGELQGYADYPYRPSRLMGLDRHFNAYLCGTIAGQGAECRAFAAGARDPIWKLPLEGSQAVVGGALVEGRLYVATEEGILYAIDGAQGAK